MNQNTEVALKKAFGLIEVGNLEDAKALLRPILESEKDNADVWWLYSHAVTDAETARLALNNVLRIEPDYPDARELLDQLESQQRTEQSDDILEMEKDPVFIPSMPSSVPGISPLTPRTSVASNDFDTSAEFPDDVVEDEGSEAFYRRPLFYIPVISMLLIAALAIVILKPFAVYSPTPQPTAQDAQSSSAATPTSEAIVNKIATATLGSVAQATTEASAEAVSDLSDVSSAFADFTLASENSIVLADTSLGKTLVVSVCTTAGKEMRTLLPKAMEALAHASTNYANQAQMISVKMLDCSANSTLLWIGSSIQDAASFANGSLSDREFQAKWQPVS